MSSEIEKKSGKSTTPQTLEWNIPEYSKGYQGSGNTVGSLFDGKEDVEAKTFIREVGQNPGDARIKSNNDPARLVIRSIQIPHKDVKKYFTKKYWEHVRLAVCAQSGLTEEQKKVRSEQIDKLSKSSNVPVLILEDYNCHGLNGPVNTKIAVVDEIDPKSGKRDPFTIKQMP